MKRVQDATRLPGGASLLVEADDSLPLVEFGVVIRCGSLMDPVGQEGLTRLMAKLMRRGTATMSARQLEDRLSMLGARLSIDTGYHSMRVGGVVLARNAEAFAEILVEVLTAPRFALREIARAKREIRASLSQVRDDDRYLAARAFRSHLFADHPYGRPISGNAASLGQIDQATLFAHHERLVTSRNLFFGASGDLSAGYAEELVEGFFGDIPKGARVPVRLPAPKRRRGRHVLIVNKRGRTQNQMIIGGLGSRIGDAHHDALAVGNTIFGGTFSSRLTSAVRGERGWSYGASSRLEVGKQRSPWSMWTHPGVEYSAECAALQLRLLEQWVERGVTAEELTFAKRFLINSHAFDSDTASKRLEGRVEAEVFGVDPNEQRRVPARVRRVSRKKVAEALKARIFPKDMLICVVGSGEQLKSRFGELPGVESVRVIDYRKL